MATPSSVLAWRVLWRESRRVAALDVTGVAWSAVHPVSKVAFNVSPLIVCNLQCCFQYSQFHLICIPCFGFILLMYSTLALVRVLFQVETCDPRLGASPPLQRSGLVGWPAESCPGKLVRS